MPTESFEDIVRNICKCLTEINNRLIDIDLTIEKEIDKVVDLLVIIADAI